MFLNFVKVYGHLTISVTNSFNQLIDSREYSNLIVSIGKRWITGRLKDTGNSHVIPREMSHMAIGTDRHAGWPDSISSSELISLKCSHELARVVLTSSEIFDNEIVYTAVFNKGIGVGSIVEAGIFNDSLEGIMLCRTEFDAINKGLDDTMTIVWKLVFV